MHNSPDVIFAVLPSYLDWIARALASRGLNVYYLSISSPGASVEEERDRAVSLKAASICPLPLEFTARLSGYREDFGDNEKFERASKRIAPQSLLQAFASLYPKNSDIVKKLNAIVHIVLGGAGYDVRTQINLWARVHPDNKHFVIHTGIHGLLLFDLEPNVTPIAVPTDWVHIAITSVFRALRNLNNLRKRRTLTANVSNDAATAPQEKPYSPRIAYVVHKGLSVGRLFDKSLYQSNDPNSELHPSNLLHFDYSGYSSPSDEIHWVSIPRKPFSILDRIGVVLTAVAHGIVGIRHPRHLIGLLLLLKCYQDFIRYQRELNSFNSLRIALIDYEILCPKELILALEANGVRTIGTLERFGVPFFSRYGFILDTCLCPSEYVSATIMSSYSKIAVHCVPVGQYRSDKLIEARQSPLPQILTSPTLSKKRIITALGSLTPLDWYKSEPDPQFNWTAHLQFLSDMLRLSGDLEDVFIVLRYGGEPEWMALPVFRDVVKKIETSDNIVISMEYKKSYYSYDLCGHSNLVVAKHTSLADECLSVGIPVLFHEYSHNTNRVISAAIDYEGARIMCSSYEQLLERARSILDNTDTQIATDLGRLRTLVFGDLGDGKASQRIRTYVDTLLAQPLAAN